MTPHVALAAAVAVLVVVNVLNNRLAVPAYLLTSLVATAVLLAVLRLAGVAWAQAGLGHEALARGARWVPVLVAIVVVCYLAAAALPASRGVFRDRRVETASADGLAYQVLVRIPFGTVLLEEVAFRGVLYGLLAGMYGTVWATAVSSALFGLWHVLPSLELTRLNPVARRTFATRPALVVPAAVVGTALAGVILCETQRRSGSLAPAIALHWATNALGYVTAFAVVRHR